MTTTLHGRVHGRTIEFDEDIDIPEGQTVEVEVKIVPPAKPGRAAISEGLARIYAILGERYDSWYTDSAERHNEHQP